MWTYHDRAQTEQNNSKHRYPFIILPLKYNIYISYLTTSGSNVHINIYLYRSNDDNELKYFYNQLPVISTRTLD